MKQPGVYKGQLVDDLSIEVTFVTVKDYPLTTSAMDKIAEAGVRDDEMRRSRQADDYILSLEVILSGLDTFIRENSKGKNTAGFRTRYDLSKPCHLTLFLLWQIRNVITHRGGVIDTKCRDKIKEIYSETSVVPVIDIPEDIEVGKVYTITFDDHERILNCLYEYISEYISDEDLAILRKRASIANLSFGLEHVGFEINGHDYYINVAEAKEVGCIFDAEMVRFPSDHIVDFDRLKIILVADGSSLSLIPVERLIQESHEKHEKAPKGSRIHESMFLPSKGRTLRKRRY